MESTELTVPAEYDGQRLDRFLVSLLEGQSRSQIQKLIADRVLIAPIFQQGFIWGVGSRVEQRVDEAPHLALHRHRDQPCLPVTG